MVEAALLLAVLVPVLVIAGIVLAYLHEKRRREALAAQASALGLVYERTPSEDLAGRCAGFPLMRQGFGRRASNVLRGRYRGHDVRLFDYLYKTQQSDGKRSSTQTHHYSVAIALLPMRVPRVRIVPENWGHKLWDALGGDDIDFESDEFSRRFWVKGDDRRFAYDLLHPRAMEYLLAPGRKQWELVGDLVLTWEMGRHSPADCPRILDRMAGFVDLFPAHLVAAARSR